MLCNKEWFGLTPAQLGIYAVQQLNPESTVYNVTRAVDITGELDLQKLERSLSAVMLESLNLEHELNIVL